MKREKRWTQIIGVLLIILLSLSTLLLSLENRTLKGRLEQLVNPKALETLQAGDTVQSVELRTLQDSLLRFDPTTQMKGTVVILLSTSCPACTKSIPFMKHISKNALDNGFGVTVISIHDLSRTMLFVQMHELDSLRVLVAADSLSRVKLKADTVPQTLLVSPVGVVLTNWVGRIDSTRREEVLRSISMNGRM